VRSRCRPVAFPDHRPPRRSRAGAPTERAAPTEARAWEHARARASTRRPTSRRADAAVDAIDRPRHARRAIRITTTRDIRLPAPPRRVSHATRCFLRPLPEASGDVRSPREPKPNPPRSSHTARPPSPCLLRMSRRRKATSSRTTSSSASF
jgi:hypothetical protein